MERIPSPCRWAHVEGDIGRARPIHDLSLDTACYEPIMNQWFQAQPADVAVKPKLSIIKAPVNLAA